ncbi:MAG: calcium:sodium antiporter [Candidatus Marinimicrobia bacterium]|nr:calcium:sodium antiporter [Candidatus Neomarinimicrobiota bacterium]|tara:strand:+ start:157 stop:1098 length:942 start_codon:yes stop_codon:yes gene_type:complete
MDLAFNIILLLLGISILVWGANKFVDHSSVIAKHLGVGDLVIGLTLIAAGTSAPEIFVAISAVINGNENIAFGTAIGSNISNIALIFGVSCLYLNKSSKTDLLNLLPFALSVLMLGLAIADGVISFNESIGFIGLFMLFMYILLKTEGVPEEEGDRDSDFSKSLFLSMIGLVGLIAGANISIIYAENTALLLGISELIIGLTIIALGTSLPELAATVAALKKGKHQMVVGNIIGSNVLNLVFVLPIIGLFGTMQVDPIVMQRDFYILVILSLMFLMLSIALTKFKFQKVVFMAAGVVLILSYILYICILSGVI